MTRGYCLVTVVSGYRAAVPSQTFRAAASTTADPAEVWARMQRPETWKAIPGVDDVFDPEIRDYELVGFQFHSTAAGRRHTGRAAPGPRVVGEKLTWDITTTDIRGTVTVDLVPIDTGTRIEVTMQVESVSLIASIGFPVIAGAIAGGLQEAADQFAVSVS